MRTQTSILALLFISLLLAAGCGAEESEAPSESSPAEEKAETTAETTVPVTEGDISQASVLDITNSFGERVEVEVEIADESVEQEQGLKDRTELAENAGMLFIFDDVQIRAFTMQDTLLPLSIAFIAADGTIVDIQDMQPLTDGPYISAAPARYALEVNQGFFANRGIEVGNLVELPGQPGALGTPSSTQVVEAFRNAGLGVGETYPVEEEIGWEDRAIPKTYTEATRFRIPSLEGDAGGRIFVFDSEENLAAIRDYYEGLSVSVKPHLYIEGQLLLQVTNRLPKEEADKYGAVLKQVV